MGYIPIALRAKLREGAYSNRESSGKGLTVQGKGLVDQSNMNIF